MYPRSYFAGRFFPPRYFPQSEGMPSTLVRMICAGINVTARIGGTADGALRIGGHPELVEC